MNTRKLQFPNASGHRLAAAIDLPDAGDPDAYVLFAHCFTCSKDLKAVVHISEAMTAEHFGVFRFDFTGLGQSEGLFEDTNFSSNVEDLILAADFLRTSFGAPALLVGHSLGGAAVLLAAARIPDCRAVAVIGSPADPRHVKKHLADAADRIEQQGDALISLAGRTFRIQKQFLDDLEDKRMAQAIGGLDRPLLVLHAPLDEIVGIENAGKIFQAARHPKSFISLDRADHLLTRPDDSRYAGQMIAVWGRRYVKMASSG